MFSTGNARADAAAQQKRINYLTFVFSLQRMQTFDTGQTVPSKIWLWMSLTKYPGLGYFCGRKKGATHAQRIT